MNDLEACKKVCLFLEREAHDMPIVVKTPFTSMLAVPEMGYVSTPLPNVYSASPMSDICAGAKIFDHGTWMPAMFLYMYVDNDYEYIFPQFNMRPAVDDVIIYKDSSLPGDLVVYIPKRNILSATPNSSPLPCLFHGFTLPGRIAIKSFARLVVRHSSLVYTMASTK